MAYSEKLFGVAYRLSLCADFGGIKAANLFTWHHTREDMADGLIDAARSRLAPYGISMEILCRCERYALIFVYREEMLGRALTPDADGFL